MTRTHLNSRFASLTNFVTFSQFKGVPEHVQHSIQVMVDYTLNGILTATVTAFNMYKKYLGSSKKSVVWDSFRHDVCSEHAETVHYEMVPSPFQTKITLGFWKPISVLPEWFHIMGPEDALKMSKSNETYTITCGNNVFRMKKGKHEVLFESRRGAEEAPFHILESRLYGETDSDFEQMFPCGVDISDFARFVFRPVDIENLVDTQGSRIALYELLPYMLSRICEQAQMSLHHFAKDSLYVTMIMDDTYDCYKIHNNEIVYPFRLDAYEQV